MIMFENIINFFKTNSAFLTLIISLAGVIGTFYSASKSFAKQRSFTINQEKLNEVYFPLITAINSFKEIDKPFDLYWYLHDKINDEKYKTLLDSEKIVLKYEELKTYIESGNKDTDKGIKLYRNLKEAIQAKYMKIRKVVGLYPKHLQFMDIFSISTILFYLSALTLSIFSLIKEPNVIATAIIVVSVCILSTSLIALLISGLVGLHYVFSIFKPNAITAIKKISIREILHQICKLFRWKKKRS